MSVYGVAGESAEADSRLVARTGLSDLVVSMHMRYVSGWPFAIGYLIDLLTSHRRSNLWRGYCMISWPSRIMNSTFMATPLICTAYDSFAGSSLFRPMRPSGGLIIEPLDIDGPIYQWSMLPSTLSSTRRMGSDGGDL